MDLALTEEQQMFQKLFRDFATKEVAKLADQIDKQEELPLKLIKPWRWRSPRPSKSARRPSCQQMLIRL